MILLSIPSCFQATSALDHTFYGEGIYNVLSYLKTCKQERYYATGSKFYA
jgi:hypothetical protein